MRWTRGDACHKQASVWLEKRHDREGYDGRSARLCFGCNSRSMKLAPNGCLRNERFGEAENAKTR